MGTSCVSPIIFVVSCTVTSSLSTTGRSVSHGVVYADTETADVISVPNSCNAQCCSTCTYVYMQMLYYIQPIHTLSYDLWREVGINKHSITTKCIFACCVCLNWGDWRYKMAEGSCAG